MRYVNADDILDEVKNEYDNIPSYEKKELFKWSLMNNHKEIYDIFLNDIELEDLQRIKLKYILNHQKYESIYNMMTHKNFKANLSTKYYITILEYSYKKHMKLFEYVNNIDDGGIYDSLTMKLVENFIIFSDSDRISNCFRSNILIDRITTYNPNTLTRMKKIIIEDRRNKLIKLKERIHEKQNT
jgi:hypothetical protein